MAFFSSCGEKKAKDGRTDTPTSGTIQFVADESLSPIIEEERSQFEFEFPKAKLKAKYTDDLDKKKELRDKANKNLEKSSKIFSKTERKYIEARKSKTKTESGSIFDSVSF